MFSRAFAATVVMIATLTTSVMAAPGTTPSCNTGPVQCCNSVQSSSAPGVGFLLGLLGIVLGGNTQVGLGCSPLSVVGLLNSGAQCSQQTVCCENNDFNGLVNVGCTPINLAL
ncbi:related to Fruiting body protein SC1 [Armillaria ostoyae]|uniref:Hydrophobin n=1 Tax=Armillaria ostoyae TaxID=47428 RepID=A0A284RD06_ARMOS|nr:related to Fruiting body protein SC1 [Armillaria ostoyae]